MQVMSQMPIENELTVILVMKLADVLKERKNTIQYCVAWDICVFHVPYLQVASQMLFIQSKLWEILVFEKKL